MRFLFLLLFSLLLLKSFSLENYLNVVLFFANYNKTEVESIAYLNVSKVAVIRPCISRRSMRLPNNYRKVMHGTYIQKRSCEHNLMESIYSLLNWARTTLHMATAVITLQTNENNNAFTYYADIHGKQQEQTNLLTIDPEKQDFSKLPLPPVHSQNSTKNDLPNIEPEKSEDEDDDSLTMLNAYLRQIKFNTLKNEYPQHYINLRRLQRTIGVPPINHQIIHIKPKKNEITSTPVPKSPHTIWNVVKSITEFKDSFLSNFVTPIVDPYQDEQYFDMSSLGEVQKRSLFFITDQVLNNVKSVQEKQGYLLVVFGGDLSMLENPYSELVQSIKHVLETCENTLVVVTSNCPAQSSYSIIDNTKIPVYATGPFASNLQEAEELLDIPKILMEILRKTNNDVKSDGEKKGKNIRDA